jgi:acyl-CoA thioester hydrolase
MVSLATKWPKKLSHKMVRYTDIPSLFSLDFEVRDYECDMQGIVNNSIYQNYMEHCRHGFLHGRDLNFATLVKQGVNLVVIKAEIEYKKALRSGDTMRVDVIGVEQMSPMRIAMDQRIMNTRTGELSIKARFQITSITNDGIPSFPEDVRAKLLAGS